MADTKVEIQGQNAIAAAQELFSNSGLFGSYEIEGEDEQEGTFAAIATIVGIVGGTLAAAGQIRQWYEEQEKGESGQKIEKVLLVSPSGRRLPLENATVEQIKQILDD
ncbi:MULTISPECIES: hypothetical protein [unclassified Coleofasciculus]|uniref:hypothetical protein n=1 Tax=unclassified Coleofasciculus TaxID=2692782 RepID=UPI00188306B9|nr:MULTISPECIES: hypothetical protein [unclassified Coleofasciculus]MBE9129001.1 hypothetical protein [Coleofasciculus sp. LEGE 07081]MBE9151580.1 hypothetical protein [Coleofasciculus sp. LEGE 07092]